MISGIYLKNFKSFIDVYFNFHRNKITGKNMISIYGENGSGKTNFVDTLKILRMSLETLSAAKQLTMDQANNSDLHHTIDHSSGRYISIYDLIRETHTINASDSTVLHYEFIVDGVEGYYELEYDSDEQLTGEELYFTGKSQRTTLFSIHDTRKAEFSNAAFLNQKVRRELMESIEQLWGKHTFLAILKDYIEGINDSYSTKSLSSSLFTVLEELSKLSLMTDNFKGYYPSEKLLRDVVRGTISQKEESRLESTATVVSEYLTNMYSDIRHVHYDKQIDSEKIRYELMIGKNIGGEIREVPAHLESKGTIKLLELFPIIMNLFTGNTVVIDELDAGIHDVLVNHLLESIATNFSGQLIFTTHDTLLMENLPASSVYIIDSDVNANKEVYPISEYTAKNNNPTAQYLRGEFNGIPYPNEIDFKWINQYLAKKMDDKEEM